MGKMITILFALISSILRSSFCWHDFTNVDYHCWPLSANSENPAPYNPCPGVSIRWVLAPPDKVVAGELFNTTSEMYLGLPFYEWAVKENLFSGVDGGKGKSDAASAKTWCETTLCPSVSTATVENCCVHHMNVHTCPLSNEQVKNGLCGPWIPKDGQVITHSTAIVGRVTQGNWTNVISGLEIIGRASLIAHFKIAGMHLALVKDLEVLPKSSCGDGTCDSTESCDTCVGDCGTCALKVWEIVLITLGIAIFVLAILGFFLHSRYQRRKLLLDESWIYSYDSITQESEPRHAFGSIAGSRMGLLTLDDSMSIVWSTGARGQMFARTGVIDGKVVTIKEIKKSHFLITRTIREEVRQMRTVDHPNLCKFIGGCVQVPNVCILMEYCQKGSLNDILLNDDVPLSWSFRLSFATDIARGMAYLHSHSICHGRLKSQNCVIDDRWTVKVTDYGLSVFRKNDFEEDVEEAENKKRRYLVYLAPEVPPVQPALPTDKGDVYAFAVILTEIATRNEAYGDEDPENLPKNWKPSLPNLEKAIDMDNRCPCPNEYCSLISSCWRSDPTERPQFDFIKRQLQKINPNKQNPVDLMMSMMEKYSNHLESLVSERTRELMLEKQKTDRLLYSMLPKAVADNLRQGKCVEAETFEMCTIFFSDIVGFTNLCSQSTSMQVVALLNRLYITFDEIIEKYDVYKVETIGDAYMVVSGVPHRTPRHAQEIADMALNIVDECKRFKIPHRPRDNLQIRVGLHSGYVCAGVVGLKMPRYCLFGDTVNTASRMESNGEPYRIHISDTTQTELAIDKVFDFEERGTIPIKGKGEMKTWWLIGRKQKVSEKGKESITSIDSLIDSCLKETDKIKGQTLSGFMENDKNDYNDYVL